jgi:hypothetical protein
MNDTISLDGRVFVVPAPVVALDGKDRMALALLTGGACRFPGGFVEDALGAGSIDLSLVRSGRCPLLAEHCSTLDSLLGQVVGAEVDGPILRCLVRFAREPAADRYWNLLQDGFPLSLSAGTTIQHAERVGDLDGEPLFRATSWRLREVSVVVFGRDEGAFVRRLASEDDLPAMVARMQGNGSTAARAAVRSALHLDRWERWSTAAGVRLGEELGTDPVQTAGLLSTRVSEHVENLLTDLAA